MIHSSGICPSSTWNGWICISDPNSGRLVGLKLRFYRSFADELVLHALSIRFGDMLERNRVIEQNKIPRATQHPSTDPRWSDYEPRPSW